MKNKSLIKEVKYFQKIAGLIKEAESTQWMSKLNPEVNGIEIYNDGTNRLFVIFDKNTGGIHVINDWNGEDFDEVWGTGGDVRPKLLAALKGSSGMSENKEGGSNDISAIKNWVMNMYSEDDATPEQLKKLIAIYFDQWNNEKEYVDSVEDFLADLEDSSDPEAMISLGDLDQYSGY